jgi:peptidyl-tRNA hydrolase
MSAVLYILMRDDLDSMNPGKAMAQASHASNAFVYGRKLMRHGSPVNENLYQSWETETHQGFGTVLVLAVNQAEMEQAVTVAKIAELETGIVHDPTYPMQDGETCHFIPLDTCAYVFGDKEDPVLTAIVQNFELHE